jgi:hypothetical protein
MTAWLVLLPSGVDRVMMVTVTADGDGDGADSFAKRRAGCLLIALFLPWRAKSVP